jgi:F420-dependent oxidoreductase-like protein
VFLPFYAFHTQPNKPQALFSQIQSTVNLCEHLGYDAVWLDDHLMFGETPILECWTTLAALAVSTKRIRLGTMVTTNTFRNPTLLAKMAATVDVVSGGRLELGLGAGIRKEEHTANGFPFPKASERIARLKESAQIIQSLWTQKRTTYSGKYFQVTDAACEPKPLQKPHPPLTIGGSGEKYLLKVTAQFADRFDFGYLPTIEAFKGKMEVLRGHCAAVGRDFADIEKSCWPTGQIIMRESKAALESKVNHLKPSGVNRQDFEKYTYVGTPAGFAAEINPFTDLGATYFMLFFLDLPDPTGLQLFAEKYVNKNSSG